MRIICLCFFVFNVITTNAQLALVKRNGLCGYINRTTKEVIPCIYPEAEPMVEGVALVRKYKNKKAKYLYDRFYNMFIDSSGKSIIPQTFSYAYPFHENRAAVYNGKSWGFIDKKGKLVIPYRYKDALYFNNGFAVVEDKNYDLIVIDSMGNTVCKKPLLKNNEYLLDVMPEVYENHIALYKANEGWGLVDVYGNIKVPFLYHRYDDLNPPASEVRYGTWQAYDYEKGFVVFDTTGKVVLPFAKEMYYDMRDGLRYISLKDTTAKKEGLFEYIDNQNKVIISKSKYDDLDINVSSNHMRVKKDGKYGFVNKDGTETIPCSYDYASSWIYNNLFAIVKDNMWKVVDINNKVVLNTNFINSNTPNADDDRDYYNMSTAMGHHNLFSLESYRKNLIIDSKLQIVKNYYILGPYNNELAYFGLQNDDEGYITIYKGVIYEILKAKNRFGKPVSKRKQGVLYYDFVSGFNATWRVNLSADGDLLKSNYW
jgi:hypothetical protein